MKLKLSWLFTPARCDRYQSFFFPLPSEKPVFPLFAFSVFFFFVTTSPWLSSLAHVKDVCCCCWGPSKLFLLFFLFQIEVLCMNNSFQSNENLFAGLCQDVSGATTSKMVRLHKSGSRKKRWRKKSEVMIDKEWRWLRRSTVMETLGSNPASCFGFIKKSTFKFSCRLRT